AQGTAFELFDADRDYPRYVDGKPRYDGVRSFLASRNIELPEGAPSDPPGAATVCGLGNRKNEYFRAHLHEYGAEVFPATITFLHAAKARGLRLAVVSSSKNCTPILDSVGLRSFFEAQVDG
ncbi:MAG: hypothetical protein GTN89_11705, partial [Acidobacteria bacterium]|nr:hypothetical protein [Acidobacteriota bacterium]NIQ86139.1 hypothetical protein [Acidobacteriota bacterium]